MSLTAAVVVAAAAATTTPVATAAAAAATEIFSRSPFLHFNGAPMLYSTVGPSKPILRAEKVRVRVLDTQDHKGSVIRMREWRWGWI